MSCHNVPIMGEKVNRIVSRWKRGLRKYMLNKISTVSTGKGNFEEAAHVPYKMCIARSKWYVKMRQKFSI